jgi:hypothetical protein
VNGADRKEARLLVKYSVFKDLGGE